MGPVCRSQCVNVYVFCAVTTWGQYVHIGFLSRCFIHIERAGLGQGTFTVFTTLWEAKVSAIHHCKYVIYIMFNKVILDRNLHEDWTLDVCVKRALLYSKPSAVNTGTTYIIKIFIMHYTYGL